ncbi:MULTISPECIES: transporter substrate-binding domain-containing protein [unclassified Pseudodesulfovibrio]|uniref:substrate-binding periplasmic protein n=1 Tax=unclassified Pseudodesulfovibrio TaxID=2661612 RepID=UPI0013E40498|nr:MULTISPECIES: transporter substrate-binding domain-containing protein [unclassified Pseudodesulfovibrio]MCJ2163107.1 transporter substrate-binding domain-containing protein [Pseudodesulfovibrio sp. S3-i]
MEKYGVKIKQKLFVFLCVVLLGFPFPVQAHGIHFYAGNLPPFIILRPDGPPTGFAVDLLRDVLQAAGESFYPDNIEVTNWARAVTEVETLPGKALLCLALFPERRDKFKWVGPIDVMAMGVFAPKMRGISIVDGAELKKYRIGMVRNTAPVKILLGKYPGIDKSMVLLSSIVTQLRMLEEGRVDLVVQAPLAIRQLMREQGMASDEYPMVYAFESMSLYFGFNKATDDDYIARLQAGLDRLKVRDANGTSRYERLRALYFPSRDSEN